MEQVGFAAGYLPLPDRMTVIETLELFGTLYGLEDPRAGRRDRSGNSASTTSRDQRTESLSSGQGTLVGFAKAVIHHPELIVLDEPTASLDPDVAMRVRDRLEAMNAEHDATLLLTSHDMREVGAPDHAGRVPARRSDHRRRPGRRPVVAEAGYPDLETMFLAEAARLREERV